MDSFGRSSTATSTRKPHGFNAWGEEDINELWEEILNLEQSALDDLENHAEAVRDSETYEGLKKAVIAREFNRSSAATDKKREMDALRSSDYHDNIELLADALARKIKFKSLYELHMNQLEMRRSRYSMMKEKMKMV